MTTAARRSARTLRSPLGFTLIELLVVISIIAVLIAILLPALANSRDAAKSVMCKARIRDVYMVVENYSNDNKDYLVSSIVWYSDPPYAYHYRHLLDQMRPYLPDSMTNWGYNNAFNKTLLYCPSEVTIWEPPAPFPAATYYGDSMTAGVLVNSGVACFWTNGYLGYGNAQFGGNLARRRMDTKGEVVYFVEANGNDPWHIGFGGWYYTKYRHGQGEVANVLRVDGHVRDVRDPITDAFLPGGGLRWTN